MGLDMSLKRRRKGAAEEIGNWRKVNWIHGWFVEHVQNGIDDYKPHEVTKEQLEELLDTCLKVLDSCELVPGKALKEIIAENGEFAPVLEDGFYIKEPDIAKELLPCVCKPFYGRTEYDSHYVDAIKDTIDLLSCVFATTDFEKEKIYYDSMP